jgi:hypothetical protein
MKSKITIIKPKPSDVKQLRQNCKEFGGSIRVHDNHVSLFDPTGNLAAQYFWHSDGSIKRFLCLSFNQNPL